LQKADTEKQFEKHIEEHQALLYKICRLYAGTSADRDDLFQEIVIQLWKAYPKFRGDSQFSTWLYRVAINTAITGLRKAKQVVVSYEEAPANAATEDDNAGEEEQLQQMYKAIEQLDSVEKAIVMLYMEERTYSEMEDIIGIGKGNLRVKMNRIKDKLRRITKINSYGT
jgi:RNA polymerase sigma-70 factor (ECF subfamily)